jgi:hypothetical protein
MNVQDISVFPFFSVHSPDGMKRHARTTSELEYREKHVEPLKKELKEFLTFPDGKQITLTEIFDHITCRKSHNLPIPKIFDEEMTKKIIAASARHWWYPYIADRYREIKNQNDLVGK